MIEVDARGLSCPEPIIQTKKAIREQSREIKVIVDNNVAKENVKRALESENYKVNIQEKQEDIILYGKK